MSGSVPRTPRYTDRGDGWTLAMELLTATFVWGGVGWLVDRWLGTAPVLMAVGFVLGNALGVYIIWVRSQDRFAREHADLLAHRAWTRAGAAPVPLQEASGSSGAGETADVAAADHGPPSSAAPAEASDHEIVAPIYEEDRRD